MNQHKVFAHELAEIGVANVPQRVHRLPFANRIKLSVLQPADHNIGLALRIAVFACSPSKGSRFYLSLDSNPKVIDGTVFVSAPELALVIEHVRKYREAYHRLWTNSGMDIDELRQEMDLVDHA